MRFPMRLDPWWRPVLLIIGATPDNSCVEVSDDRVDVSLGVFRYTLPRADVVSARHVDTNWTWGIGVHTNFVADLVVNGSLAGMVELALVRPYQTNVLGLPVRCQRLHVSVEDPDGLIAALTAQRPAAVV